MMSALILALGAALFTILGFRELFEPTLKITFMAASIELGKVVAVSVIYQFRDIMNFMWKSILFLLIIVAMGVTSMGVYGYLSSSYQKDSLSLTQNKARLELLDKRKTALEYRLKGIDTQIQEVPETYVTKRMELMSIFKPERDAILKEMETLDNKKLSLRLEQINQETEFGAILLLAKSIEWLDPAKSMLYFILAVIFIFDPMAIALTYAANVGYANAAKRIDEQKNSKIIHEIATDSTDMLTKFDSILKDAKADKRDTDDAINSVADSVNKIAEDVGDLKNQKPVNPRAEVIDSMRNQKT